MNTFLAKFFIFYPARLHPHGNLEDVAYSFGATCTLLGWLLWDYIEFFLILNHWSRLFYFFYHMGQNLAVEVSRLFEWLLLQRMVKLFEKYMDRKGIKYY